MKKNSDQADQVEPATSSRPHALNLPTHGGADQSHRGLTNINLIIAEFQNTGALPQPAGGSARYADFSSASDLQTAFNLAHDAQDAFDDLPSAVRNAAMNNPVQFAEMLNDPEGIEILKKAGLADEAKTPPSPEPPTLPKAPPEPAEPPQVAE